MKDFFKNVAATIVGLFAFGLIMTILGFICIIGMVASSNSKPALKDNAVMVLKLQGQIEDRSEDNWLGELTGEQFNNLGMNKILSSIRKAKDEDKGERYLSGDRYTGDGLCHFAGNQKCTCRFQEERQMDYRIW